ncbi:hypothetical protein [Alcanivorax sp.]|uniref:hypothetical protein n=1 Tax=Alcanivorax sp. TaxID=1872427 RepID=UPI0025B8EC3C|nr:hypothetical protein [Alcanivorax sp.]
MQANSLPLDGDRYQILRLVMVNSGSAAYINLPLGTSSAIFSPNNQGKTSGLSALKLFLLPEVNMKRCESKFGFASNGEVYSGQQSFDYYFPSSTSFLVLEASNPGGEFCIVLYQTPNEKLGYSRIAVPMPYEAIEHIFWDVNSGKNDGMGSPPEGLALAEVIKKLKDIGGRPLADQRTIMEAMFTRYTPTRDSTRYCIVPLVQPPRDAVMKAIKALLQLSFDIRGGNKESLPLAFANVIDSDLATGSTAVSVDLRAINDEKLSLQQALKQVQALKNNQDAWAAFAKQFREYEAGIAPLARDLVLAETLLEEKMATAETRVAEAAERHQIASEALRTCQEKDRAASDQVTTKKVELKNARERLERLKQRIDVAEAFIAQERLVVQGDDPGAYIAHAREWLGESERRLKALSSVNAMQARLQQLISDQKGVEEELHTVARALNDSDGAILDSLNKHSAMVLFSLNSATAKVPGAFLSVEQDQVDEFAALFSVEKGALALKGQAIPGVAAQKYSAADLRVKLEDDKKSLTERKRHLDREMRDLNADIAATHKDGTVSKEKVAAAEEDVKELEEAIHALGALESNRADLVTENEALAAAQEALHQAEELHVKISNEKAPLQLKAQDAKRDYEAVQRENSDLTHQKKAVSRIKASAPKDVLAALGPAKEPEETVALAELITDLEDQKDGLHRLRESMLEKLRTLLATGACSVEGFDMLRSDIPIQDIRDAFERLRAEFENVVSKENGLRSQIENHNQNTGVDISKIEDMAQSIRRFEQRINNTLAGIHISNLSGVSIEIKTHEAFESLRRDLDRYSKSAGQMRPDAFYERLSNFCDHYLKDTGNGSRLDIEQIVTDVKFVFELNGEKEKAGQSTGTTGMVNVVLLAILLRQMVPEDITMTVPVIFDEVSNLDERNLAELRRVVEENNLVLIAATPSNTGVIAGIIGTWHYLYEYQLTEGKALRKCRAVYHPSNLSLLDLPSDDDLDGTAVA